MLFAIVAGSQLKMRTIAAQNVNRKLVITKQKLIRHICHANDLTGQVLDQLCVECVRLLCEIKMDKTLLAAEYNNSN
jgi:hypothetical protein